MKYCCAFLLLLALSPAGSTAAEVNPLQKVIQLISELQAKVIAEGEAEGKQYRDYFEYCDDASKEKQFEIKTAKAEVEDLTAAIEKHGADIESLSTKIEELAAKIATNDADLKAATEIREKEHADFAANEVELVDAVDTLGRAIKILEKHVSMLQEKGGQEGLKALTQSFTAIIDATALSLHDKNKLQSLLQASQSSDSEDDLSLAGAPEPAAYKGHSKGIVSVLEDMLDEAEDQLSEARKEEMGARHNYEMIKQSLEDAMKFDGEEKATAGKALAKAQEDKATAEGDLANTSQDLADAEKTLKDIQMQCMTHAQAHEESTNSRAEELKAIAEAKKVLQSMTGGAESRTYNFLQLRTATTAHATTRSRVELVGMEALNVIKKLARTQKSMVMAQLASRMEVALRAGARAGDDVFAKVKGLIRDMIEKLLNEAAEEASHKAWCDEEMGETKANKEKLEGTVEDLNTKIESATATIQKLTEEVATLQEELAALAKLQGEMDKARAEEHEEFVVVKADLEQGLEGVRRALKVLRDYYAKGDEADEGAAFVQNFMQLKQPEPPTTHSKAGGAASGIIGILEVVESDFARSLAEAISNEESAQEQYDKTTQENKVTKATKEKDVEYKNKERAALEKKVSEAKTDLADSQTELDAVLEYYEKLKSQCIAKPESYEERKARREAEIAGLKEALTILEGESFLQVETRRSFRRGIRLHA